LQATTTPSDNNNVFCITLDGADAANQTINFSLFSLFPPTYKGRENGMRMDIAEVGVELIDCVKPGELKIIYTDTCFIETIIF